MFVRSFVSHVCICRKVIFILSFPLWLLRPRQLKGGRPITFSLLPLLSVSPDTLPSFSLPRRNYTSRGLAGRRRERGRNWKGHTLRKDAISQRAANLTLLQSHDAGGAHGNSQSTYSKKNCRSSTLGHSLAEVRFHGGNQYRRAVTICPPTTNRFRGGISIRKAKKEAVFKRTKRRRERWRAGGGGAH